MTLLMAVRRAAAKSPLHSVCLLLLSAAVLVIAALAMPSVLKVAAKSFNRLPTNGSFAAFSRQLTPAPFNRSKTAGRAITRSSPVGSSVAARSFSGGPNMSTQALTYREPIVFNAREKHTGTIIMLHGLGDSGEGWAPVGAEWAPELKYCKFIFPNAPNRSITVNFGMRMPGWYDIASLEDIDQREDKEGLHESRR
eukprot:GHUV01007032.1.p1 GENE.GHUV01007032.1~~GHUV01007032.1.p1  ORF type:complete len:196 (+),score=43.57 GHUV01007032.1:44-631(+)